MNYIDCEAKAIFPGKKVIVFHYHVENAKKNKMGLKISHRYSKYGHEYVMTIPWERLDEGILDPKPIKSQYSEKIYYNVFFNWQPDEDSRIKRPNKTGQDSDNRGEQQGRLL